MGLAKKTCLTVLLNIGRFVPHQACDTKYYTTVEDRPVEKEVIERVVEHHPVEKKFVVETRPAGEHELTHQRRASSNFPPLCAHLVCVPRGILVQIGGPVALEVFSR